MRRNLVYVPRRNEATLQTKVYAVMRLDDVSSSTDFPSRVDVAIVGGGIIGVCAGYELVRRGLSVAIFEKGVVAGEQSGRNWGWVRQQNRHPLELPLAMHALRRWNELGTEIGDDLGFRREGILYCATCENDMEKWRAWSRHAAAFGFSSRMLSGAQARRANSFSTSAWIGGVHSASDGRAEPDCAVPAMAKAFMRLGGGLYQQCAVRGLDTANERIHGIWTERGRVGVDAVLMCAGAWTSRLCRRHDIALPAVNVVGTVLKTAPARAVTSGCTAMPSLAIRRRADAGYTVAVPARGVLDITPWGGRHALRYRRSYLGGIEKRLSIRVGRALLNGPEALGSWAFDMKSPFEKCRILNPKPHAQSIRESLKYLRAEYPALADVTMRGAWAGAIDTTPDMLPVIDSVNGLKGAYIASGFSGHGFGLGPGGGRLAADIVTGAMPVVDPHPYRLARFFDGSNLEPPTLM